ncbi:MAG: recombination regulator RecX [Oscillospiraceae bacterium]|nr:recombination regulator RecX [Oscillospiraceae bacterium]
MDIKPLKYAFSSFEDEVEYGKKYALRVLNSRAVSVFELKMKMLRKGFSEEAAESVIDRLREAGLLDDKAYTEELTHSYANRGYGRRRIDVELRRRGVYDEFSETAQESYEELDTSGGEEDGGVLCEKYLRKLLDRMRPNDDEDEPSLNFEEKQALRVRLLRRGFSADEIELAMKKLLF